MNAPRFHPNCAAQKRRRSNGCNGPARRGFAPALSGGRRGGLPGPLAARRVSGGGPLCMGSTDIRAHVRLNTFAEWTSKTASAAFDIPYHSHLGGASQGAGKVFSQLFAFQRRQRPGACTSALTSGPVSTTIIYGRLDDLRQGFCPRFLMFLLPGSPLTRLFICPASRYACVAGQTSLSAKRCASPRIGAQVSACFCGPMQGPRSAPYHNPSKRRSVSHTAYTAGTSSLREYVLKKL